MNDDSYRRVRREPVVREDTGRLHAESVRSSTQYDYYEYYS